MEYQVVWETGIRSISELEKRVQALIKQGWQPAGGVSVGCRDNGWPEVVCQAMVKYPPSPPFGMGSVTTASVQPYPMGTCDNLPIEKGIYE